MAKPSDAFYLLRMHTHPLLSEVFNSQFSILKPSETAAECREHHLLLQLDFGFGLAVQSRGSKHPWNVRPVAGRADLVKRSPLAHECGRRGTFALGVAQVHDRAQLWHVT